MQSTVTVVPYVMVRTQSAGVFAGYLEDQKGKQVTLTKVRRIWYWEGAASCLNWPLMEPANPKPVSSPSRSRVLN